MELDGMNAVMLHKGKINPNYIGPELQPQLHRRISSDVSQNDKRKRKADSSEQLIKNSRKRKEDSVAQLQEHETIDDPTVNWLRCPYQVGNPSEHSNCGCYDSRGRLNDHLRDKHLKTLECDKCYQFKSSKHWNFRRHRDSCKGVRPRGNEPYIPVTEKDKELLDKINEGVTWKDLYKAIFNNQGPTDGEELCRDYQCSGRKHRGSKAPKTKDPAPSDITNTVLEDRLIDPQLKNTNLRVLQRRPTLDIVDQNINSGMQERFRTSHTTNQLFEATKYDLERQFVALNDKKKRVKACEKRNTELAAELAKRERLIQQQEKLYRVEANANYYHPQYSANQIPFSMNQAAPEMVSMNLCTMPGRPGLVPQEPNTEYLALSDTPDNLRAYTYQSSESGEIHPGFGKVFAPPERFPGNY
ncbi:hypothetical protein EDC01DRAFT_339839 [Geopyxis carbonaria]|nr:hypothetical protein EDC01DRAFT_339839 [Geopyxis carbonaria]